MSALLQVEDLSVTFGERTAAVRGISLEIAKGETHCLVGESGCGKSVTALAVMNLLARGGVREARRIALGGEDMRRLSDREMARIRGNRMAMIFQEPMTSLNPAYTVGSQMAEVLRRHRGAPRAAALDRAVELMRRVGITAPELRLGQFPHQLSGGLRQRVMIAMALMCDPELLIADEPTTALDVTVQAQILRLLSGLQRDLGLAILLITHDLGIVARVASRVSVMYAGEVVESAPVPELFARPMHPYTRGLLTCVPVPGKIKAGEALGSIPGVVPTVAPGFQGCAFRSRCSMARPECASAVPRRSVTATHNYLCRLELGEIGSDGSRAAALATSTVPSASPIDGAAPMTRMSAAPAIEVRNVGRIFNVRSSMFAVPRRIVAVDDVSFALPAGRVLGVVGESGCGKSTLARLILGLLPPTFGEAFVDGRRLADLDRRERARLVQPVFQDPFASLNPRRRVRDVIALPLTAQGNIARTEIDNRVDAMLERVGLTREMGLRMPAQLSGGQRQRVAIARALVLRPRVVICDEPTSALDVSVQAQILNLLAELRRDLGLTYLFISHNLAVVEHVASEVAVMYLGRIVEQNQTQALFRAPRHPYTKALLASVLTPEPGRGIPDVGLGDTLPDPANLPPGCRFHPRCQIAVDRCRSELPRARMTGEGRMVECHLAETGVAPTKAAAAHALPA
jgi:peptide/nickel transport system ATP-binding protein